MVQSLHQSEGMILISLRMGRLMKTNLAKSSLFWTTVMYKYMFLQPTTTTTTVCSSVITQTSRLFFAQGITVQAVINNVTKTFTLNNLSSVSKRSSDNDYQLMVDIYCGDDHLINYDDDDDDDGVTLTFNLKDFGEKMMSAKKNPPSWFH